MEDAISNIADAASWKLRTLLRTARFYSVKEMVHLYKSKIWSFIECKTAAIYHSAKWLLLRIDRIQDSFNRSVGISELEALCEYRLAPLCARRDMAVLGIIHRTVLGLGPKHFQEYFRLDGASRNPGGRENVRRHDVQLRSYRTGRYLDILGCSILGAIDIYNLLPASVVAAENVSVFQKRLQANLVMAAKGNEFGWKDLYSPRLPLYNGVVSKKP